MPSPAVEHRMAAARHPHGHRVRGRWSMTPVARAPAATTPRTLHGTTIAMGLIACDAATTAAIRLPMATQYAVIAVRVTTILPPGPAPRAASRLRPFVGLPAGRAVCHSLQSTTWAAPVGSPDSAGKPTGADG